MKAKDSVKLKYPNAFSHPMIDNLRQQTSYVILKGDGTAEFIVNTGAKTASKAWTDAKRYLSLADDIRENYKDLIADTVFKLYKQLENKDIESAQSKADDILCDFIKEIGLSEIANLHNKIGKRQY